MTQEALRMALDFVETVHVGEWVGSIERQLEVITAVKKALAQTQEPVAIVDANDDGYWADILPNISVKVGQMLYTNPPQRTWVGLTDEEMTHAKHHMVEGAYQYSFKQGAKWAEDKLKQKNGYAEENA
jgi:hypothetical protein